MIGSTISHYTIMEELGRGGMGVVYKARDTTLDRFVALKFLPSHLSASEQDKTRFILEAKAASALNHPNVCTIHAIEQHEGQLFIAMEYVEGHTLRERKQSYSLKQTVDIAAQVADGLAAAHEHSIIHRDIKPENIMMRKDGIVQIMDFGLAKLGQTTGASRLTKEGSTIGTIGYMSPEQVQGLDVDHRTDIFSLGVVLYELLSNQMPFKGVHETAIMYEIVNVDAPPLSSILHDIDPELDRIVLECLDKDRDERYQSAKELAKDLKRFKRESGRQRISRASVVREAYSGAGSASGIRVRQSGTIAPASVDNAEQPGTMQRTRLIGAGRIPWIVAIASAIAAVVAVTAMVLKIGMVDTPVVRSSILSPPKVNFNIDLGGHIAISPNGQTLAFVGTDSTGRDQLWVRPLSSLTALPLPGTDNASYPFWSPDSRYIGFFASGKMKKIEVSGGPALTICDAPQGRGGTWNSAGVIVFAPTNDAGLSRVSSAGGTPTRVTSLDSSLQEVNHRWPWFLPDGNSFLYVNQTSNSGQAENDAIFVGSLNSSIHQLILHAASNMAFVGGRLLFERQDNVVAQPFDDGSLELKGEAVPIAEQVQYSALRSRGIFSVSENGVLVYQSGAAQLAKLSWVDENGKQQRGSLGEKPPLYQALISPDGKSIVLDSYDPQSKNSDIWVYDIARDVNTRLTYDRATEIIPCWSPDGRYIIFSSDRKGHFDLYEKSSNGTGNEELVYESTLNSYVTDWSSDGKFLLLSVNGDLKWKWDLYLMPMSGDRKPTVFLQTTFNEWVGRFSPDAHWIAYQSDESGKYEVYVRPVQGNGGKWQVSTSGGDSPFWSRDGRKIFYTSGAKLMAVDVNAAGVSLQVGTPQQLFDLEVGGKRQMVDISPDGRRFLMTVTPGETSTPITLVTHWERDLERK